MTYSQFIVRYPEFETTDPDFVAAVLAEAGFGIDVGVYGLRYDAAQGSLAAHKIYVSPYGVSLRGDSTSTETSEYLKSFQQIRRESSFGMFVVS